MGHKLKITRCISMKVVCDGTSVSPAVSCSLTRLWPSPSSMPLSIWFSSSSVNSWWCSFQLSPVSLRRITSSLSFPLSAAKWGTSTITGLQRGAEGGSRSQKVKLEIQLCLFCLDWVSWLQSECLFMVFDQNSLKVFGSGLVACFALPLKAWGKHCLMLEVSFAVCY